MKAAPVIREMSRHPSRFEQFLVHTGQHYDARMSSVFFRDLGLPAPDENLEVGSGPQGTQTGRILERFEKVACRYRPEWVFVYGDVNSTVAAALASCKLGIKVAHVEAGLRSFDRSMPEEINRLLTDQIADALFTPSRDGDTNLLREGIRRSRIHFVGNVMIDTLVTLLPKAKKRWPGLRRRFDLNEFALVTLHRPSNVDERDSLALIMSELRKLSVEIPVLFPVHPRTRRKMKGLIGRNGAGAAERITLVEPLGYLEFLAIESRASLVVTDSGGVQEETTYLGVPCLTVRPNTERPVTLTHGTNRLLDIRRQDLRDVATRMLRKGGRKGDRRPPPLWDGRTARRIVAVMLALA